MIQGGNTMAKTNEPSTLFEIIKAVAEGAASPSTAAKAAGGFLAPPGAKEAVAQGLQMGANAALAGSKGFIEGVVRQHGESPAAKLNNLQIQQAIETRGQSNQQNAQKPAVNKGIEAARQKAAAIQTETKTGQSTNQGIKSYQEKASGQSAGNSKGSASGGQSKGNNGQGR